MDIFNEYDKSGIQIKNYLKRYTKIFNIFHYQPKNYCFIPMIFFLGFKKITYRKVKRKVLRKGFSYYNDRF